MRSKSTSLNQFRYTVHLAAFTFSLSLLAGRAHCGPVGGKGIHRTKASMPSGTSSGLDYADTPASSTAAVSMATAIAKARYTLVGRYYSNPANNWKILTSTEGKALSAKGLLVFVVYENAGAYSDTHTYSNGYSYGQQAYLYAYGTIHQPTNRPIYFAIDEQDGYALSEENTKFPNNIDFLVGVHDGMNDAQVSKGSGAPTYPIGVYAGGDFCAYALGASYGQPGNMKPLVTYTWLCASSSYPGFQQFLASNKWSLWQYTITEATNLKINNVGIDQDYGRGDTGAFLVP